MANRINKSYVLEELDQIYNDFIFIAIVLSYFYHNDILLHENIYSIVF
jgi:hypothetical protein